jgi:hypothetical protein
MKKIKYLLIITVILNACSNKQSKDTISNIEDNNTQYKAAYEIDIPILLITRYVNSKESLRVRDMPAITGEVIYTLQDKEPVNILKRDESINEIDGLTDYWYYIQKDNIKGWVFGGYLVKAIVIDDTDEDNGITGTYSFISVNIIDQQKLFINDIHGLIKDLYIDIVQISEGYYQINYYNFAPNFSEQIYEFYYPPKYENDWFPKFTSRYDDPLICSISGEKGGGGTYIYFYYSSNRLKINYLYSQFRGNFMEDPNEPDDVNEERLEFNAVLGKIK